MIVGKFLKIGIDFFLFSSTVPSKKENNDNNRGVVLTSTGGDGKTKIVRWGTFILSNSTG